MFISTSHLFDVLKDIFNEWDLELVEADIHKLYIERIFAVEFEYKKDNKKHGLTINIPFHELTQAVTIRGMSHDTVFVALLVHKLKGELTNGQIN